MKCIEVGCGTYACSYSIKTPFKTGFANEYKYISVDKCLLKEIADLWEMGIKTTGCCCGHDKNKPYIGVEFEFIDKMKELGYKVQFNPCRPEDEDTFYPKTTITYGEVDRLFDVENATSSPPSAPPLRAISERIFNKQE